MSSIRLVSSLDIAVAASCPTMVMQIVYFFFRLGRPTLVLLMGQACGAEDARPSRRHIELAEIVEMIHTASLAHDDVLDEAETRRGQAAMNARFGNKLSVLVGDFLLARASVALAGLRDHEVTGLLSAMIAELVEGEFVQLHPSVEVPLSLFFFSLLLSRIIVVMLLSCFALLSSFLLPPRLIIVAIFNSLSLSLSYLYSCTY